MAISPDFHIVEGFLTGGNRADISVADDLTADVFGCFVVEDKGYDSDEHRRCLELRGNIPVIPGRKNRKEPIQYNKNKYSLRKRIENMFGRMKENKRLSMRYEKSDIIFMAFIAVAAIKMNLC